ncbi:hypothetical protein V6R21_00790 [Limibacter armeniacum]|uniref:hypothetical protein n=1 Tax=Limibacter armeniacum TaxID=466084 RepID=UPI002FE645C9
MKNKYILLALLFALFLTACEEELEEPNQFSDVGWYTSMLQYNLDTMRVAVDKYISFSDLSQGTLEHSWTIPESGKFLSGTITRHDSTYTQFIVENGGVKSSENTIHVLFTEPTPKTADGRDSVFSVTLYNTFPDSVSFRGIDTIPAVYENGRWVMEKEFLVKVYDTIAVEMQVKDAKGTVIDHTNEADTIRVEAGETLTFLDLTTQGEPDSRTWEAAGITSDQKEVTITYKKLGSSRVFLTARRTAQNIPAAATRYRMPAVVKVIPSTKPFELFGELMEQEDQTIHVAYNGEFNEVTPDAKDLFTATLNGASVAIQSVSLNKDDATIIDLKLAETIYSDDVITVSYAGGLKSTDTRKSKAFADKVVVKYDANMFDKAVYDFEAPGWLEGSEPDKTDNTGIVEYSTEQAASGTTSLKLTGVSDDWVIANSGNHPVDWVAGETYILTFKIWIDPNNPAFADGGPNHFGPWFMRPGGNQQRWTGIDGMPRGEWVTVEKEWKAERTEIMFIQMRFKGVGVMYFDDFKVVKKNVRPL